jgi:hypothetical protein
MTKLTGTLAAVLVAASLLFVAQASAQDRRGNDEVTHHTFDDADQVVGDTPGAQGEHLQARRRRPTNSLIRLRTHFRDSLLKSVEIL